jgi:hypothetical protein
VTQREDYRAKPAHPWSYDTKDFYLYGKEGQKDRNVLPVPVDFRTTKENIRQYTLHDAGFQRGVRAISDGTLAARAVVNEDGSTTLVVMKEWNYPNLRWGNYERVKKLPPLFSGEVRMQLLRRTNRK